MQTAPVLLFTYRRLDVLKQTITALQKNFLAGDTEIFIFSDGPKNEDDKKKIKIVRDYLKTINGFKKVILIDSDTNKGLAKSIIEGVTQIINQYGRVIVLEDDLITSRNFLAFMNQGLAYYFSNYKILSIAGFGFNIKGIAERDVYFTQRSSSWGWATWKDRWVDVDWEVKDYLDFKNNAIKRKAFNTMGSDLSNMLDKQIKGKIDSWAIRWCFHQFKHQTYTAIPSVSKVRNIGFAAEATHTKDNFSRYDTFLDQSKNLNFNFTNNIQLEPKIIHQFTKHYSVRNRVIYKIMNAIVNYAKLINKFRVQSTNVIQKHIHK